ncbi:MULTISPECIES: hypothetical protein [Hydrocarboniphaga]|uniref:hypothetical protein n=1 Tax=Hydrocarboniphaga TaxID=243627 RepID=UPI002AB8FF7B|nr:hypothetical protein [Hydrocarboniphaga sp.]MDZ4078432.1 hypothetical protein [Hydrocarboniphaga sp.]
MIEAIRQGLKADGFEVSVSQLCRWFGFARRTIDYRSQKAAPKVQARFAEPIKALIEEEPSFGYRTVAALLGFNKNTVQRLFQIKGWQVKKRPVGHRPRIEALPSKAQAPNQRWATDLCRVWAGRDGWASLAVVIDCHTRTAGLAPVTHWPSNDSQCSAGTGADCPIRHAGACSGAVSTAIRQWFGFHEPKLHGPGSELWPEASIHHAALPPAERHGGARDPIAERAVRTPASLRNLAARQPRDQ